jgi:hypothetical protein
MRTMYVIVASVLLGVNVAKASETSKTLGNNATFYREHERRGEGRFHEENYGYRHDFDRDDRDGYVRETQYYSYPRPYYYNNYKDEGYNYGNCNTHYYRYDCDRHEGRRGFRR